MKEYGEYITERKENITSVVEDMKCQPILFIGSGLSIRYFDGPNWEGLLEKMVDDCPTIHNDIDYFLQGSDSYPEVGSKIADEYYKWAGEEGNDEFPEHLGNREYGKDIYLKYKITEYLKEETPDSLDAVKNDQHREEIELLKEIQPHAIITTNYDPFLESIFPDYQPIVGEQILHSDYQSIGEILKIHGCVSEPASLVVTQEDYKDWKERKKYLSSKLLTYFAEHPVLIAGYGLGDKNVQKILSDIDEILATEDGLVENLYFLEWEENLDKVRVFERYKGIATGSDSEMNVNYIQSKRFDWVFRAFSSGGTIDGVDLKLLRTVMANTYDIVRTKAPREEVEINYDSLQRAADSGQSFGTLFGVSTLDDPVDFNLVYQYRISDVAEELGYDHWRPIHDMILDLADEHGKNIKESDNSYHIDISVTTENPQHRYSGEAIQLFRKIRDEEDYEFDP